MMMSAGTVEEVKDTAGTEKEENDDGSTAI
jgi:hypothetical protein